MDLDINISLWIYDMYDSVWFCQQCMMLKHVGKRTQGIYLQIVLCHSSPICWTSRAVHSEFHGFFNCEKQEKFFPKLGYDETSLPRSGPKL